MTALVDELARACTAAGLLAGLLVLVRTRDATLALKVALELWTAAGLLRLVGATTWTQLATAAAIVALRQLINRGLRRAPLRVGRVRPLLRTPVGALLRSPVGAGLLRRTR